jgi:transposase InsO family protein
MLRCCPLAYYVPGRGKQEYGYYITINYVSTNLQLYGTRVRDLNNNTIPGDKVPRPFCTQLHAIKPNEILHLDFLYIGLSRDGKYQYLLLLKECFSGYPWLVPCRTVDAAATVDALMRWFAVFCVVLLWVSDRDSHFKNEVVRRVQKELKAKHNFTTANCPWSNGTIKSACKQVIRASRAVLSELKMYADEWLEVVSIVQRFLNNSLSTRLNKERR